MPRVPIDLEHPSLLINSCLDLNLWQYAYRAVPMAEILPDYQSETGEYLKDAALRLAHTTPIWVCKDVSIELFHFERMTT